MNNSEQRGSDREKCYAKFILNTGRFPGYVRDVSNLGLRIEIPGTVDLSAGDKIQATITPVEETEGQPFGALLEVRWNRWEDPFTALGLKLLELDSDEGRLEYAKLIEYYDMNIRD
ncbi:MAG: PilZ domain-containing protein [Spirochaetales bacterium]|nr:PilZ domain-containing protein [Spirochaetales bacterium]